MVVLNSEPLSDKKSTWNILTQNPLNYNSLKITKLHDDRVKTESARTLKLKGGGRKTPLTACLGLKLNGGYRD